VRYTVSRRLSRLSDEARHTLAVASVIGREFAFEVFETVGTLGTDALLDVVEESLKARLVVGVPGTPGRYAFVHALVRQTLYEELTDARRARLHQRVGEALEKVHSDDVDPVLPALAHHFLAGAGRTATAKAAVYALRAAQRALDQAAHEDAAAYLERGLAVLEANDPRNLEARCDLLLALARTRAQALDHPALRETSLQAAELARATGSGERLARAAYWYNARAIAGTLNPVGIALCEEALSAFEGDVPSLRALVLATLARERAFGGEGIAVEPLSHEALELARSTGDPEAIAVALVARYYTLWGSDRVTELLDVADELSTSTAVTPSGLLASTDAHRLRAVPLLMLGDVEGFRAETEQLASFGDQLHSRFCKGMAQQWRAGLAFLEGRFADAEPLVNEALAVGQGDENFKNAWAGQMFFLHGETGRLEAVAPLVEATVEQNPGLDAFRAALAFTYAVLGRLDDARRQFEILAVDDFGGVSRNILWPNSLALLSEVCSVLEDRERAELLLELFRPYSRLLVVYAGGSHSSGAVDRYLGMLETVLGRFADAEAHLDSALALEDRVGSPPLLARTRYWYARMLLVRDDPGDRARACELLTASSNTAEALGMTGLVSDVDALATRSTKELAMSCGDRLSRL
jgi:tetratricopeptide (TPR) repeat protein